MTERLKPHQITGKGKDTTIRAPRDAGRGLDPPKKKAPKKKTAAKPPTEE